LPESDLTLYENRIGSISIVTEAKPSTTMLLRAREVIRTNRAVRDLFCTARKEGWESTRLADAFMQYLEEEDRQEAWEAALYVADEYAQVGDKPLLVHQETGRAICTLTDEDLWQPPLTLRSDGSMVERPLMVNPMLLSGLLQVISDTAREQAILQAFQERCVQTQYLRDNGDPRLDILTRSGRASITARLQQEGIPLPVQGDAAAFFEHFQGIPEPHWVHQQIVLDGTVALNIADLRTTNLRYDVFGASRASIGRAWARSLAQTLMRLVPRPGVSLTEARTTLQDAVFLVGPEWAAIEPRLVIDGVVLMGFKSRVVGALDLHSHTEVKHIEISDRMEIRGEVTADLWLDLARIEAFTVPSPQAGPSEVLH
jgi:hypothetical protein